jgi:hypothetical protein
MKIGVFGDSFAANVEDYYTHNTTPSWVDILTSKYKLTNFARTGSSLCFSVENFIKHHEEFDKVIFVVTSQGRLTLVPPTFDLYNSKSFRQFVPSITIVEMAMEELKNIEPKFQLYKSHLEKMYTACYDYFLYVMNDNHDRIIHNALLNEIKNKRKNDLILIPGAHNSITDLDFSIAQIQDKENQYWKYNFEKNVRDIRHCHMSAENNEILAQQAMKWLTGSPVYININDFVLPNNKEYYLRDANE